MYPSPAHKMQTTHFTQVQGRGEVRAEILSTQYLEFLTKFSLLAEYRRLTAKYDVEYSNIKQLSTPLQRPLMAASFGKRKREKVVWGTLRKWKTAIWILVNTRWQKSDKIPLIFSQSLQPYHYKHAQNSVLTNYCWKYRHQYLRSGCNCCVDKLRMSMTFLRAQHEASWRGSNG